MEQFEIHRKISRKCRKLQRAPPSRACAATSADGVPLHVGRLLQAAAQTDTSLPPRSQFSFALSVGVVRSVGLGRCLVTRIHRYSVIATSLAARTPSGFRPFAPPSPTPATTDLALVSLLLPFPGVTWLESHTIWPLQTHFCHSVVRT